MQHFGLAQLPAEQHDAAIHLCGEIDEPIHGSLGLHAQFPQLVHQVLQTPAILLQVFFNLSQFVAVGITFFELAPRSERGNPVPPLHHVAGQARQVRRDRPDQRQRGVRLLDGEEPGRFVIAVRHEVPLVLFYWFGPPCTGSAITFDSETAVGLSVASSRL